MGLTGQYFAASSTQRPVPQPRSSTFDGGVLNTWMEGFPYSFLQKK